MENKYLCTKTFIGKVLGDPKGEDRTFEEGQEFPLIANVIAFNEDNTMKAICIPDSHTGHTYFTWNGDNKGKERRNLIDLIAYSDRKRVWEQGEVFRFSKEEYDTIRKDYSKFIKTEHASAIIFNHYFFHAPIEELEELAKYLELI